MMKYSEVALEMNKTAASVGEIGWNAVGALGGGALGYALSRILHRKRSGIRSLLYALAGAGTGLAGINYAMDRKSEDGGKTWREKLQAAEDMLPEIEKAKAANEEANNTKRHWIANIGALAGAGTGIWKGWNATGLDISGRSRANEIVNSAMKDKASPLTTAAGKGIRQQVARNALGTTGGRSHGILTDIRHPRRAWTSRVYNRVVNGDILENKGNWTVNLGKPGQRLANAGHVAADVIGNAALLAALGYGGGRLAESLGSNIGTDTEAIKDVATQMLNR